MLIGVSVANLVVTYDEKTFLIGIALGLPAFIDAMALRYTPYKGGPPARLITGFLLGVGIVLTSTQLNTYIHGIIP